jgi:hypothetical protein|tara:strand:+ start:309 stop:626 length:318 start_codon:yes stop_codon:yes gene_type:complete
MPLNKDMLKEFEDCVNELKEPLLDMAKEYPTGVLMGAMLEVSLRMIMMSVGSSGALKIFGGSVANIAELGPLIDAMVQSGTVVDPLDFTQITGVRIVPDPDSTIH